MQGLRCVALCAMSLWLTGCYPLSVQPLFTEKDLIMDPRLEGVWQKVGDEEQWIIRASGQNEYKAPGRREVRKRLWLCGSGGWAPTSSWK